MRRLFQSRPKDRQTWAGDDPTAGGAAARSKIFPAGIKLLHSQENSVVDIVFIHGLTGDRERTWTAKEASSSWPQTLLPSKIPDARILTFGYDAYVADWRGVVSQARIANHAWNLLTALSTYREEDETNERPIVFVCHSLGGLVCEDALVTSKQRSEPHLQSIFHSTGAIVFIGTPHHGAGLARWAEMLARSIGYIKQTNHDIVEVLKRDSEVLARIQDSFHTMIMARNKGTAGPIQITCFYEQLPLPGIGLVVPQDSAILPGYIPIGIRANHMDMTKFDSIDDPGFVAVCGELRRWLKGLGARTAPVDARAKTGQEEARYVAEETPPHSQWLVPFGRNKDFVGRESILAELLSRIPPSADPDDCQRTAVEGLGGVGKTQIALEAAFRVRDEHADCSVFWVPAVDVNSFENAYREIGRELKVEGIDEDKADVKVLVKAALSRDAGRWLLIIDNADDEELPVGEETRGPGSALARHLPFSRNGSILFTTRNRRAAAKLAGKNIVAVPPMDRPEALKLLETNLADECKAGDAEITTELLDLLAHLPLAIRQASAYINENQISAAEYLEIYKSDEDEMIYLLSQEFEDRGRYNETKNPIAATWVISFRQILRHNPLAADYLRFMCFLAQQDIPQSLLPADRKAKTAEAIGTLKGYAFITERASSRSYDIHRLVQVAARNWLKEREEWNVWATKVIRRVAEEFPFPEHENRDVWMRYLPHAQAALEFRGDCTEKVAKSRLLSNVAVSFDNLGKYRKAEKMHCQTLELRETLI